METTFALPLPPLSAADSVLEPPTSPNTLFLSALASSMLTASTRLVQGYPIALLDDDVFPVDAEELQFSPTPDTIVEQQTFPPSPCSALFPSSLADPLLSPVLEEDEDLYHAFPEYEREELRRALRSSGLGRAEERFVFAVEKEEEKEKVEGKKGVSFAPSPIKKQRPAALTIPRRLVRPWTPLPSPSKLSPFPSPLSSGSSQGSSPSSATFSDGNSSLLSVPTSVSSGSSSSGKPSPASSNASSPQAHSFPSTRASSTSGTSSADPSLSRCTTRTVHSSASTSSSAFSGKSTRRFLKRLFSPSSSTASSATPSAPPSLYVRSASSSRLTSPFLSRQSSSTSVSAHSTSSQPPPILTLTPLSLSSLQARFNSDTSLLSVDGKPGREAKELKKALKRLEKVERRERERVQEERLEREWREKRERRKRCA